MPCNWSSLIEALLPTSKTQELRKINWALLTRTKLYPFTSCGCCKPHNVKRWPLQKRQPQNRKKSKEDWKSVAIEENVLVGRKYAAWTQLHSFSYFSLIAWWTNVSLNPTFSCIVGTDRTNVVGDSETMKFRGSFVGWNYGVMWQSWQPKFCLPNVFSIFLELQHIAKYILKLIVLNEMNKQSSLSYCSTQVVKIDRYVV